MADEVSFFEQLKQRHVFRVAAMYAVTAWLLLQVGSVTFEPLGLPPWSQRALIIVIAIGFPIALVLAWIFDATPAGIVRSDGATTGLSRGRKLDIVIIGVLIAALVVTFLLRREPQSPAAQVADSSVAVLPFVAMSEDASLKHLGEGLAEQITNNLASRPDVRVASRTSAFEQTGKDAIAIARTLGVSYVLEGSVRPADDRVRVTAQFIRGADGTHLWSETYDVGAETAELDRAAAVAAFMVMSSLGTERTLAYAQTHTGSPEAFQHYAVAQRLRDAFQIGRSTVPKPWEQMLDEVDRAIAFDPDFIAGHLLRANIFINKLGNRACGARCAIESHRSVDRALAVEPNNPFSLLARAGIELFFDLDPAACETTLDGIRRVAPDTPPLNESYAALAMFRGNARDARDYAARQIEVSPYNPYSHAQLAIALFSLGDVVAADRSLQTAMQLAPRGQGFLTVAAWRAAWLASRGEVEQAKKLFEPLWAEYRYSDPEPFALPLGMDAMGHQQEARGLADRLAHDATADPYTVFLAYYGLGDYDAALIWLRHAIDDRGTYLSYLRLPNLFGALQQQPGYADAIDYLESLQKSR